MTVAAPKDGNPGLRERKKAETRAALQDAAMRLAAEHGPDKVTVDEVAAEAGVSPRTFFNYFPSKDDAIIGLPSPEASPLVADLRARPADESPLAALQATLMASMARLETDPDRWALRTQLVQRYPDLGVRFSARMTELEQQLAVEVAERVGLDIHRDIYPTAVTGAVMGVVRAAMALWREHDPAPLSTLLDDGFSELMRGFSWPPPAQGPSGPASH